MMKETFSLIAYEILVALNRAMGFAADSDVKFPHHHLLYCDDGLLGHAFLAPEGEYLGKMEIFSILDHFSKEGRCKNVCQINPCNPYMYISI